MISVATEQPTSDADAREIAYHIAWNALSQRPGAHKSRHAGPGGRFRDVVPFMAAPDPRRIDLRQSLRDPWQSLHVRRFAQPAEIDVVLLVDVSGSMGFRGRGNKMELIAELADILSRSAQRIGDRFCLLACDDRLRDDLGAPLSRTKGGGEELPTRLKSFVPSSTNASALLEAAQSLAGRKRLVILVSDFRLQDVNISALLDALAQHDVLAIVLEDSSEVAELPTWGLMSLQDLETGQARTVVMRPSLKSWLVSEERQRHDRLRRLISQFTRDTVFIRDRIDWHKLGAALRDVG